MDRSGDDPIVNVSRESAALSEPMFVIRVGGKFYLTLAVWEYAPDSVRTEEQAEGLRLIERAFKEGEPVEASRLPRGAPGASAAHTRPPSSNS